MTSRRCHGNRRGDRGHAFGRRPGHLTGDTELVGVDIAEACRPDNADTVENVQGLSPGIAGGLRVADGTVGVAEVSENVGIVMAVAEFSKWA